MDEFRRACEFVLAHEGGLVDDPDDPGGRTDRGISAAAHPEAWADGKITDDEVERIYQTYWLEAGCETQPWPLSLALFDFAFTSGPGIAKSHMRLECADPLSQALELVAARVYFLNAVIAHRPTSIKYLRGWRRRCADVATLCIESWPAPAVGD